jgi:hypothetical protein
MSGQGGSLKPYTSRYNLLWRCEVKPDGVTAEEVPEGWGAGHAMIFVSLLYPPDGSFCMKFVPVDGRVACPEGRPINDSLDVDEVFKCWWLMASALASRPDLSEGRRKFCEAVFDSYVELAGLQPGSRSVEKPS